MAVTAPRPAVVICEINGETVAVVDLDREQSGEHVRSLGWQKPDPKWTHVDSAGHFHAYGADGTTPTLVRSGTEHWCEDCQDEHWEYVSRCVLCDEEITPGTIHTGPQTEWVAGPVAWTLKVAGYRKVADRISVRVTGDHGEFFGIMHWASESATSEGPVVSTWVGSLSKRMEIE